MALKEKPRPVLINFDEKNKIYKQTTANLTKLDKEFASY